MPKDNQIPAKYRCSITSQIIIDPVFAADGYTYEREAIEQWLQTHDTSPRTNEKLDHKKLTANHDKRSDILDFLDSNPELYMGDEVYLPKSWVAECATAIKQNQLQAVQRWLDKDKRLLSLKLEGDSTALHLACEFSSPELVDTLLKILKQRNQSILPGAVRLKPRHLNVLLEKALNNADPAQCALLLRLGAEVEQPDISSQNTLLHRMVIKGKEKAVSWLLEQKADLESRNREGNTPLLLSVIHTVPQQPPTPSSPTLIFRALSPSISFHLPGVEPNLNPKEVEEFLRLVAEGEQGQAEAMLKSNPNLALVPGDVTDLSKRSFNGITAFQYAVWALDWHMWTMIRKYLPDDAAREQAQGFETGTWVRDHGAHANLNNLIQAYQTAIDLYNAGKYTEGDAAWVKQVGGAQLLLPAHVINEYCHPTRPFYPLPNFKDAVTLPRSRTIDHGEWFTAEYDGGKLGNKFSVVHTGAAAWRLPGVCVSVELWLGRVDPTRVIHRGVKYLCRDHESVIVLTSARTAQREELIAELMPKNLPRKAA